MRLHFYLCLRCIHAEQWYIAKIGYDAYQDTESWHKRTHAKTAMVRVLHDMASLLGRVGAWEEAHAVVHLP